VTPKASVSDFADSGEPVVTLLDHGDLQRSTKSPESAKFDS